MEDREIVGLYWARDEEAIGESRRKYGGYCTSISQRILDREEDVEECVADTWLGAWNAIPPHRPAVLSTFLGKLVRRLSIDRWRRGKARKRGGGELDLALEELRECVAGSENVERELERREMEGLMARFLGALPQDQRQVFLRRYWYLDPVAEVARRFGCSESKVTSMLHRTREKLRKTLEKEGWI